MDNSYHESPIAPKRTTPRYIVRPTKMIHNNSEQKLRLATDKQDYESPGDTSRSFLDSSRQVYPYSEQKSQDKIWLNPDHPVDVFSRYPYEDIGPGNGSPLQKGNKLKALAEKHEARRVEVSELVANNKQFRWFSEYDNVKANEIIITIEFCSNCLQHQSSTHHDEEKYAQFTKYLKKEILAQYPIVKVVLKPNVVPSDDMSAEAIYLRTRIGALEIQLCSNINGKFRKRVVFSKLMSNMWPCCTRIIDDISRYLPRSEFIVRLFLSQEYQGNTKLEGMRVVMRPYRHNHEEVPAASKNGNGNKSKLLSPRLLVRKNNKPDDKSINVSLGEYIQQADEFGVVCFNKIPHNVYEIEVLKTEDFVSEKKVVNIFHLVQNKLPLIENFELKELPAQDDLTETIIKDEDSGMDFLIGNLTNLLSAGQGPITKRNQSIQTSEKNFEEDKVAKKDVWEYENGDIYDGYLINNKREGLGKMIYAKGNVYKGNWEDDKRQGKGEITYLNGDVYEGYWNNDQREGQGKIVYVNGDVYEGYWSNNQRNGKGIMNYTNGDLYEGYWRDGQKDGRGKRTYNNGEIYEGYWYENKREGKGVMTYLNRDVYYGYWNNNEREGPGKMVYAEGDVYEGYWENGKRQGKGIMRYKNGDVYDSYWKNDEKEDEGKMIYVDENSYEGVWKDSKNEL